MSPLREEWTPRLTTATAPYPGLHRTWKKQLIRTPSALETVPGGSRPQQAHLRCWGAKTRSWGWGKDVVRGWRKPPKETMSWELEQEGASSCKGREGNRWMGMEKVCGCQVLKRRLDLQ